MGDKETQPPRSREFLEPSSQLMTLAIYMMIAWTRINVLAGGLQEAIAENDSSVRADGVGPSGNSPALGGWGFPVGPSPAS